MMTLATTAARVTVVLVGACALLAASIVWLILTDPVTVVTAVNRGDLSAVFDAFTQVVSRVFQAVVRYL